MRYLKLLFACGLILTLLIYSNCGDNFIPDPAYPDLPIYSEEGNMIAGAYVNNIPWRTHYSVGDMGWNRSFYFINSKKGDSLIINMDGLCEKDSQIWNLYLRVVLKGVQLNKTEDLKILNGQELLDGSNFYAIVDGPKYIFGDSLIYNSHGVGIFTIKSLKEVSYYIKRNNGEYYHPLIVSGIFNFSFKPVNIRVDLGRFDFRIDDDFIDQK